MQKLFFLLACSSYFCFSSQQHSNSQKDSNFQRDFSSHSRANFDAWDISPAGMLQPPEQNNIYQPGRNVASLITNLELIPISQIFGHSGLTTVQLIQEGRFLAALDNDSQRIYEKLFNDIKSKIEQLKHYNQRRINTLHLFAKEKDTYDFLSDLYLIFETLAIHKVSRKGWASLIPAMRETLREVAEINLQFEEIVSKQTRQIDSWCHEIIERLDNIDQISQKITTHRSELQVTATICQKIVREGNS